MGVFDCQRDPLGWGLKTLDFNPKPIKDLSILRRKRMNPTMVLLHIKRSIFLI